MFVFAVTVVIVVVFVAMLREVTPHTDGGQHMSF